MSEQLDNLTAKVEKCNTVMDLASTLLKTLSDEIRSLKDDPAALEALASRLDRETIAGFSEAARDLAEIMEHPDSPRSVRKSALHG